MFDNEILKFLLGLWVIGVEARLIYFCWVRIKELEKKESDPVLTTAEKEALAKITWEMHDAAKKERA